MKVPDSIDQLVAAIEAATIHIPPPSLFLGSAEADQISCLNEEQNLYLSLEEWSGIKKVQLPLEATLSDSQIQYLLPSIKNLLAAYHCSVIFHRNIPERIQYRVIRERFNQKVPAQKEEYFSFSLCDQLLPSKDCIMGQTYCHCALMSAFFKKYRNRKEETKEPDEIEKFREYILEKRYGADWRLFLDVDGQLPE